MKQITIKFIHPYPPYAVGETATFFEREADRLTDRGFAVYVSGNPEIESQADRLKALRGVNTRHIPGPEETKTVEAPKLPEKEVQDVPDTNTGPRQNRRSQVEGKGKKSKSRGGKGRGNK